MDSEDNLATQNLCDFCCKLVKPADADLSADMPNIRLYHPTWKNLFLSGKECQLCQSIASLWQADSLDREIDNGQYSGSKETFPIEITTRATRRMASGILWSYHEATLISTNTPRRWLSYFTTLSSDIVRTHQCAESRVIETPLPGLENDFNEKVAAIRAWLQECRSDETHVECRPEPFVPFRLISVGLDGKPPRLVTRENSEDTIEYTTLSYCWGRSPQLCTTKETLAHFEEAIPSTSLPKTYLEAMHISKACGIPYIWIDALCIVQDDESEWQGEAAKMAQIYRGSQLTISATQSSGCFQGCFLSDAPGYGDNEKQFLVQGARCGGKDFLVRVFEGDVRYRALSSRHGNILATRGWALQEQLLSLRNVSCMQPEVHWQCQGSHRTQCGLAFTHDQMLEGDPRISVTSLSRDLLSSRSRTGIAWRGIVQDYSERELTYPRDRGPALAGIARRYASLTEDTYILGLWKGTFAQDLAWLRLFDEVDVYRPKESNLPSWSWLSCPGVASYSLWHWPEDSPEGKGLEVTDHLQLLDFGVEWTGLPDTSQVKSAFVEVRGSMLEIPIRQFAEGNSHNPPYFQVFGEDLKHVKKREIPWRCVGQFDTGGMPEAEVYSCLLLTWRKLESSPFKVTETFLILQSVGSENDRTYRRVGLARLKGVSPSFDLENTQTLCLI